VTEANDETSGHPPAVGGTPVARSAEGEGDVSNTLQVDPEHRHIDIFSGVEFNNKGFESVGDTLWPMYVTYTASGIRYQPGGLTMPAMSQQPPLDLSRTGDTTFEYLSEAQGVRYTLEVHNDRATFGEKLQKRDAFVMYCAHARYGRGPCFGDELPGYKGEKWQRGDLEHTGIFTMGYPFLSTPVDEITSHEYTARLARVSDGEPTPADCPPVMQQQMGRRTRSGTRNLRPRSLEFLDEFVRREHPDHGRSILDLVEGGAAGGDVWAYWGRSHHGPTWFVVHRANYEDLLITQPQCRVFCHLGCDTKLNRPIWVERLGRTPEGDHGFSYWTSRVATWQVGLYWIYYLLGYDQPNGGQPWGPWLSWAQAASNRALNIDAAGYQIIDHAGRSPR
jgi:hypothetical protein